MKPSVLIGIIVVALLVIGGIWWFVQEPAPAPVTDTSTATETQVPPALGVGTDAGGSHLQAADGMTLYTYQNDSAGSSTCTDTCAAVWPPYLVGSPDGITADPMATGTVATITRGDGTLQVTYNGIPLYFYSSDVNPGDTTGDGVDGVWHIARP